MLHLICSKIHTDYDKWCFGIQTAYNTGNYLYIKSSIFMLPTPCNETHFHSQSHLHNTVCITRICCIYSDMFQHSNTIIRRYKPICLKSNGYDTTQCIITISQSHAYNVCNTTTVLCTSNSMCLIHSHLTVVYKYPLSLSWLVMDPVHVSCDVWHNVEFCAGVTAVCLCYTYCVVQVLALYMEIIKV